MVTRARRHHCAIVATATAAAATASATATTTAAAATTATAITATVAAATIAPAAVAPAPTSFGKRIAAAAATLVGRWCRKGQDVLAELTWLGVGVGVG